MIFWRRLHIDPIEDRIVWHIHNRIGIAIADNFYAPSPFYLRLKANEAK